jgi:hypothetical protein
MQPDFLKKNICLEKVLSPSLNYQRTLVSVPDPENRVSYFPELSKPSIFRSSLVLMVIFDDVQRAPHVRGGPHSLSSPLLLCGKQVRRLRRRGRDRAARGRKEASPLPPSAALSRSPWPKLLPWCKGVAAPDRPPRGERGKGAGEAWAPPRWPPCLCHRREAVEPWEGGRGGRRMDRGVEGKRHWEGGRRVIKCDVWENKDCEAHP